MVWPALVSFGRALATYSEDKRRIFRAWIYLSLVGVLLQLLDD